LSPNFKKKNDGLLYHLKVLIKTDRTRFSLEKNAVITISNYQMEKNAENMNVNIPSGLSMNILLAKTKNLMGGKFLTYSAYNNNCQSLILAILQSNNLSTPQNVLFTKQSTQELFTPNLRKITNTITDIAGKVDIIRQGGELKTAKKPNPWVEHVKQFAKDNNIGYFKALSDPKCKATYRKVKGNGIGSSRVSPTNYNEFIPVSEIKMMDFKQQNKSFYEFFTLGEQNWINYKRVSPETIESNKRLDSIQIRRSKPLTREQEILNLRNKQNKKQNKKQNEIIRQFEEKRMERRNKEFGV
jgi:hypothetical protein